MTSFQIIEDDGAAEDRLPEAVQTQRKKGCGASDNEVGTGTGSATQPLNEKEKVNFNIKCYTPFSRNIHTTDK